MAEVGPLAAGRDIGVRSQDLLDQGGSRTRHADDEDQAPAALALGARRGTVEDLDQRLGLSHVSAGIDVEGRPHQVVAAAVMVEGVVEGAGIGQDLAGGKMQLHLLVVGLAGPCQRFFNGLQPLSPLFVATHVGKEEMRRCVMGIGGERLLLARPRLVRVARLHGGETEMGMGVGASGIRGEGGLPRRVRFLLAALGGPGAAEMG